MKLLHLLLFFFIHGCASSFAQENDQNIDWRILNYYLNEQYDEVILASQPILESHPNDPASNRVKLILARTFMQTGEYEYALEVLQETELDAEFFGMGIQGMMGDCRSQQGKYSAALAHYQEAINANANEALTPYYLFKAYLCAEKLDRTVDAQKYIQTIIDHFPSYTGKYSVNKYLISDSVTPFKLTTAHVSQPEKLGIGTVNGVPVSERSFYDAFQIALNNAHLQAMQSGQPEQEVDPDRVWNSFASELVLQREYNRLQLYTDDDEMMAYLLATDGFPVQPEFLYSFSDDRGNFSPEKLLARIDEMMTADDEAQREAWQNTADYYQQKMRQEKYFNLLRLLVFVTDLEVQQKQSEIVTYEARFFCERFRDVSDDEISISDQELRSYYEKHKYDVNYQIKRDHREVLLVREEIQPTKADTVEAFEKAEHLKKLFKKTKDDSSFVVAHSGLPFYTSGPYSTAIPKDHRKASYGRYLTYPNGMSSSFDQAKTGEIVGPYVYNDELTLAKVIGRTDEVINARHILLMTRGDSGGYSFDEAQKFFKSVTNENFAELAKTHSEDSGSANKGGDLGDFFFGDMVPNFATFCADAPLGDIGFVQTQFGYHIVQVTKRSGKKFPRLAIVTLPIELSEESYSIPKNRLDAFRSNFESETIHSKNTPVSEEADRIAEELGTFVRRLTLVDNAPRSDAFDTQNAEDTLFEFAYDPRTNVGDISPIFKDSLSCYTLILGGIHKKGVPSFESVKEEMRNDLLREKKSSFLQERINSFSNSHKESKMKEIEITLSGPLIHSCGYEPNVVGKAIEAYHSDQGAIVASGSSGIFFIEVTDQLPNSDRRSVEELQAQMTQMYAEEIKGSAIRALETINQVVDNRSLYRLGIRP